MTVDEMKVKYGAEKVLCVYDKKLSSSNMTLEEIIEYYGFTAFRFDVENNTEIRQIIPYVVVTNGDKVFRTTRIAGDERLVGKQSIGIGGHIDSADVQMIEKNRIDVAAAIDNCIVRELNEEINMNWDGCVMNKHESFVDDSDDVSKVHLCLLYTCDTMDDVTVKETEKLEGSFVTVEELYADFDKLENWSQIALKMLFPITLDKNAVDCATKISKSQERRVAEQTKTLEYRDTVSNVPKKKKNKKSKSVEEQNEI